MTETVHGLRCCLRIAAHAAAQARRTLPPCASNDEVGTCNSLFPVVCEKNQSFVSESI